MNTFFNEWIEKWDRVVVFGGVFDPVHKGHISAARAALREGRKVYIVPERVPQHKHGATAYEHRKNMLMIATQHEKHLGVLDYPEENQKIVPFFSWLADKIGHKRFVWLVGSDVLLHMPTWNNIEKIPELGVRKVIYLDRDGKAPDDVNLPEGITAHAITRPRWRNTRTTHARMQSSVIRANLSSLNSQLPDGVYEYIKQHQLYL